MMGEFLRQERAENEYCMAGFVMKNTLSDNGGVTRGICEVDERMMLRAVRETKHIVKTETVDGSGWKQLLGNYWDNDPEPKSEYDALVR